MNKIKPFTRQWWVCIKNITQTNYDIYQMYIGQGGDYFDERNRMALLNNYAKERIGRYGNR